MSQTPPQLHEVDSHSSVCDKVPADLRRDLDRAVVDRDPPTYRALFKKFNLAEHGVSLTAFFYYARRLRAQAELIHLARIALPEGDDITEALPGILAHRLFDAADDEAASPRTVQRLADAWRIVNAARLAQQRHQTAAQNAQKKIDHDDIRDIARMVKQYGRIVKEEQRVHLARAAATAPGDTDPQT